MGRLRWPATVASALGAGLFAATALPGLAQGPAPAGPVQPPAAGAAASPLQPQAPPAAAPAQAPLTPTQPSVPGVSAQPPAGQPDVAFTATLRIAALRFNEPPQASIQVIAQPTGQPVVDLRLANVPGAPQAGTTYRDVGVQLTVTGALADIATGTANPGAAPPPAAPPLP